MVITFSKPTPASTRRRLALAADVLVVLAAIAVLLLLTGAFSDSRAAAAPSTVSLPASDEPPLEYIYLDTARVESYLGQVQDGLARQVQRTEQRNQSLTAGLTAGTLAQVSGSQSAQEGSQETVTATAADSFYLLLRLLRKGEDHREVNHCPHRAAGNWLGDFSDVPKPKTQQTGVSTYIGCAIGSFVRLTDVQLFLPPFAQVLPNAQSANVIYGPEPWVHNAFTSPTQSINPKAIARYARAVGPDPRLPFVAAPYGSRDLMGPGTPPHGVPAKVGHDVTFFLPVDYRYLTSEPSLLSSSVTVVGKVVYAALTGGPAYVDYPTISEFAPALLKAHQAFSDALGVCSHAAPHAVLATAKAPRRQAHRARQVPAAHSQQSAAPSAHTSRAGCYSSQAVLHAVKSSVTLKPPFVVILPLAIYK